MLGLAGFAAYMVSYALVQVGRMDGNGLAYTWVNLTGASLVLVSLLDAFNLASALTQVAWIVVSVLGLGRRAVTRFRRWWMRRRGSMVTSRAIPPEALDAARRRRRDRILRTAPGFGQPGALGGDLPLDEFYWWRTRTQQQAGSELHPGDAA